LILNLPAIAYFAMAGVRPAMANFFCAITESSCGRGFRVAVHDLESRVLADILLRKVLRFADGSVRAHMHEGELAVGAVVANLKISHPNSALRFIRETLRLWRGAELSLAKRRRDVVEMRRWNRRNRA
jgi:hypothetical protein